MFTIEKEIALPTQSNTMSKLYLSNVTSPMHLDITQRRKAYWAVVQAYKVAKDYGYICIIRDFDVKTSNKSNTKA